MPAPFPFENLGPYKLIQTLGKGGMGSVFLGRHVKTGQEVAVKLIAESVADEPKFRRRFDAEVKSLQHLRHPHIVRLIGFGEEQGRLFYSMELAVGESLHAIIRREKRIDWQRTIDLAIQVCSALKHAHDIGVIHRDLKPANLVVDQDDQIKLVDFGIAKIFGQKSNEQTMAGSVLGTADYMAPEQAEGVGISQRTDLYALGSLMYAMVTGKPPFRGKNVTEVIESVRRDKPVPLDLINPELPDSLIHLVHDLLEKDPEDRPPTALAVSNRLKAMRVGLEREKTLMLEDEPTGAGFDSRGGNDTDADAGPAIRGGTRVAPGNRGPSSANVTGVSVTGKAASRRTDSGAGDGAAGKPQAADARAGMLATLVSVGESRTEQFTAVDDGESEPSSTAQTHYQTAENVGESTSWLDSDVPETASSWQTLLNSLALVGVLAAIIVMGTLALRSPSADELYERAQNGDRAAIDSFIATYPSDPRTSGLVQRQLAKRLMGILKRLQTQSRLAVTELTPAEEGFLTAMRDRQTDPATAAERIKGWIAVFDDPGASNDNTSDLIELARFEANRLESTNRVKSLDPRAIELMTKINDSVQREDDADSRATLKGVIDNFADKAWAGPAVDEARLQLEVLDEFSQ